MSITEEQLAELERLEREATPGPWLVEDKRGWWRVRGPGGVAFDDGSACNEYNAECDADTRDLIVAARNALPQLLAEVRRLRDENAMFRGTLAAIASREVES